MFGQQAAAPKDFEVAQPPTDGITALSFSPQADYLAASSFDKQVPDPYADAHLPNRSVGERSGQSHDSARGAGAGCLLELSF